MLVSARTTLGSFLRIQILRQTMGSGVVMKFIEIFAIIAVSVFHGKKVDTKNHQKSKRQIPHDQHDCLRMGFFEDSKSTVRPLCEGISMRSEKEGGIYTCLKREPNTFVLSCVRIDELVVQKMMFFGIISIIIMSAYYIELFSSARNADT